MYDDHFPYYFDSTNQNKPNTDIYDKEIQEALKLSLQDINKNNKTDPIDEELQKALNESLKSINNNLESESDIQKAINESLKGTNESNLTSVIDSDIDKAINESLRDVELQKAYETNDISLVYTDLDHEPEYDSDLDPDLYEQNKKSTQESCVFIDHIFENNNNQIDEGIKVGNIKLYSSFSKEFIAQDISTITNISEKDKLFYQSSDKIILPQSSLQPLAQSNSTLYVLRITNKVNHKYTFVCAHAFNAPERNMFVPSWVLQLTQTVTGERMYVDAIGVPVITEISIKVPAGFSKLQNPLAVIEFSLRNHSILFTGKKISINIFDKQYIVEIVSMSPSNIGNITNADIKLSLIE